MRTVLAVHHFPPRYASGAELRAYRTAAWLRDHGCDVHAVYVEAIASGDGPGLTSVDKPCDGLPVRRLSFRLASVPDLFRWTYELAPDLLHLISGYLMSGTTLRAAMGVQIPTVFILTNFWFLCPRITLLRSSEPLRVPPLRRSPAPGVCVRRDVAIASLGGSCLR